MSTTIKHGIMSGLSLHGLTRRLLLGAILILGMASCSEDDDTVDEWANWQSKNDTYWTTVYTQAQQRIASGDTTWKLIPCWTMTGQQSSSGSAAVSLSSTDYIVVHVENNGSGTASPMYTDSVRIHYLGRMIPSPTYTDGLVFDASYNYNEPYNLLTMRPYDAQAGSFIKGFTTALLSMHKGDRWTVYIPYQLAYGSSSPTNSTVRYGNTSYSTSSSSTTGIQPYSNLIFDITLVDFYKPGETIPVVYSKGNIW